MYRTNQHRMRSVDSLTVISIIIINMYIIIYILLLHDNKNLRKIDS
jgi:hypothetical protein